MENKAAQTSASWLSGGPFQRQIVPQAALSFGQPRPISRFGRAGRPYRPCFPLRVVPTARVLRRLDRQRGQAAVQVGAQVRVQRTAAVCGALPLLVRHGGRAAREARARQLVYRQIRASGKFGG